MVAPARERRTGPGLQVDSSVASRCQGVPVGAGDDASVGDGVGGTEVFVAVAGPEDAGDPEVVLDCAGGAVGLLGAADVEWRVGCLLGTCVGVDVGAGRFGWY